MGAKSLGLATLSDDPVNQSCPHSWIRKVPVCVTSSTQDLQVLYKRHSVPTAASKPHEATSKPSASYYLYLIECPPEPR